MIIIAYNDNKYFIYLEHLKVLHIVEPDLKHSMTRPGPELTHTIRWENVRKSMQYKQNI